MGPTAMHVKGDTPVQARASYEQRAYVKPVPILMGPAIPQGDPPHAAVQDRREFLDTRSHRILEAAMHPFRNDPSPRRLSVGMPA